MKKFAFSLLEILVVLAIIGVVTALLLPNLRSLTPNREKGLVLKLINSIESTTQDMLSDPSLYREQIFVWKKRNIMYTGLGDKTAPSNPEFDDFSGDGKFVNILTRKMSLIENVNINNGTATFDYQDMECTLISTYTEVLNYNTVQYDGQPINSTNLLTTTISIHFKGKNTNCNFDDNGCNNPDTYTFSMDNDGKITGTDSLAQAYLLNPDNLKNADEDYKVAKTIQASRQTTQNP